MICCRITYRDNDFKYINYNGISEVDNLKLWTLASKILDEYRGKLYWIPELENCKGDFIINREGIDELYDDKLLFLKRLIKEIRFLENE